MTVVLYACLIEVPLHFLLAFLPFCWYLPRAAPEAICSRASAKMSSKSPEMASLGAGLVCFGYHELSMCCPERTCLAFFGLGSFTTLGGLGGLGLGNGQGALATMTVLGCIDCSRSLVDDVFFDDVQRLFKLTNSAVIQLSIVNFHGKVDRFELRASRHELHIPLHPTPSYG